MESNKNGDDSLDIPDYLKRSAPKAPDPVQSEVKMSDVDTEADPVAPAPAPKARKPRKAAAKGNGAAKPPLQGKAPPKAKKAASKPAKAKAKAPKKAKAPGKKVERDEYGFSVNSIKSKAAAMYASKKGATLEEVKEKLNSVQLNLLTYLSGQGYKVSKVKEDGPGNRQVTRYYLRAK